MTGGPDDQISISPNTGFCSPLINEINYSLGSAAVGEFLRPRKEIRYRCANIHCLSVQSTIF